MQSPCQTTYAVLLVGCRSDASSILRFPSDNSVAPGLWLEAKPQAPIEEQLIDRAAASIAPRTQIAAHLNINPQFTAHVVGEMGESATLYVATLDLDLGDRAERWSTMPALLRAMPADRNRLAYLRAWQVYTGGLEDKSVAIEANDLAKILREQIDREQKS